MNNVVIDIPGSVEGKWSKGTEGAISYGCDGLENIAPDRIVYRGGNTIEIGNQISGQYRLMIKCGHNAKVYDVKDCNNLTVTLDRWKASNVTGPQA